MAMRRRLDATFDIRRFHQKCDLALARQTRQKKSLAFETQAQMYQVCRLAPVSLAPLHLICLHNVIADPIDAFDEKCSRISVDEFDHFLDAVAARFDLIPYSRYEALLRQGETSPDAVALSFDDGFLGVFDHARPALDARDLDAIAFINPPYLGNPPDTLFHFLELEIAFRLTDISQLSVSFHEDPFNLGREKTRIKAMKTVKKLLKTRPEADRARGHAEVLAALGVPRADILSHARNDTKFHIMTDAQVRDLHQAGWAIGSHAMSHRTLSMLSQADRVAEISEAAQAFKSRFGWAEMPFAYPYGDVIHVGPEAPKVCAEVGHPMAYTTVPGPSDMAAAPHLLPRVDYKRFLREEALFAEP